VMVAVTRQPPAHGGLAFATVYGPLAMFTDTTKRFTTAAVDAVMGVAIHEPATF